MFIQHPRVVVKMKGLSMLCYLILILPQSKWVVSFCTHWETETLIVLLVPSSSFYKKQNGHSDVVCFIKAGACLPRTIVSLNLEISF